MVLFAYLHCDRRILRTFLGVLADDMHIDVHPLDTLSCNISSTQDFLRQV